jgi:hypothetical protein
VLLGRASLIYALSVLSVVAHADSAKLVEARQAIAEVRYIDARALLVDALREGDNSPAAVAEIYQLSARTAAVLHEAALAEQYYCRWLALEPDARLSEAEAPKLRERFVAAQAFMAGHGRLSVKLARTGEAIDVTVVADPLAMVVAAALDGGLVHASVAIAADHRAHLVESNEAARAVVLLDEHGNRLLELPPPPRGDRAPPPRSPPPPDRASVPILRRPLVWTVAAAAFVTAGGGFAIAANNAQDELATIVQHSTEHFYSEASQVRERRDRDALLANIGFGVGAACAVTAILTLVWPHREGARVTIAVPTHGIGAAVSGAW